MAQVPTEKCGSCTDVLDKSCPGNSSCVVPAGVSSGVCLPVPKMGQSYANSQINQLCHTSFPEVVDKINSEEQAVSRVKRVYPEVEKVKKTENRIGQTTNISSKEIINGWKLVFWQGSGDCPAGCINNHYWYFTAYKNGKVEKVGEYERIFNSRKNSYDEKGSPIWDFLKMEDSYVAPQSVCTFVEAPYDKLAMVKKCDNFYVGIRPCCDQPDEIFDIEGNHLSTCGGKNGYRQDDCQTFVDQSTCQPIPCSPQMLFKD